MFNESEHKYKSLSILKTSIRKLKSKVEVKKKHERRQAKEGFTLYITSHKENLKPFIKFLTPFYNYMCNIDVPSISIKDNINNKELLTFDNSEIVNHKDFKKSKYLTLILDHQITVLNLDEKEIREHLENLITTFCN